MRSATIALTAGALAATLILAGCSHTTAAGHTGMDGGTGRASASGTAGDAHNDADASFVQNMIMHHQQALEMSGIVVAKTDVDARVTELARKIMAAQQPEIDTMNGWLKSWKASMGGTFHDMGGMMSESDMSALTDASGADASRLFLTQMIRHHRGAITMANQEVQNGKSSDAVSLAKKIVADQAAEIATMNDLLRSL